MNAPTKVATKVAQVLTQSDQWEHAGIGRDEERALARDIDKATGMPELLATFLEAIDAAEVSAPLSPLLVIVRNLVKKMI